MSRKREHPKNPSGAYYYSDLTENPLYGFCGEENCIPDGKATEKELLESISLIEDMLEYAVERKDKDDIASWRRMLQGTKDELRQLRREQSVRQLREQSAKDNKKEQLAESA